RSTSAARAAASVRESISTVTFSLMRPRFCRAYRKLMSIAIRLSARAADRDLVHAQRRLADADRHALTVLAAGADAGVEFEIVADHGDAMQVGRAVTDQHRAFQRRAEFAVLDAIGFRALEYVFAGGNVDLTSAEIRSEDTVLDGTQDF